MLASPPYKSPDLSFISPTTSSLIFLLILELVRSSEVDSITPDSTDEKGAAADEEVLWEGCARLPSPTPPWAGPRSRDVKFPTVRGGTFDEVKVVYEQHTAGAQNCKGDRVLV